MMRPFPTFVLLFVSLYALAGCDSCDRCGMFNDSPYPPQPSTFGWELRAQLMAANFFPIARFPANDPLLALEIGRVLGRDCLGMFDREDGNDPNIWIWAQSEGEAQCISEKLQKFIEPGKVIIDRKGPPNPFDSSMQPSSPNAR